MYLGSFDDIVKLCRLSLSSFVPWLSVKLKRSAIRMDEAERFQTDFRLQLEHYHNLNNPLHLGRFQNIVYEFMERVRADAFDDAPGQELMEEFCDLVDNDHVWHLAETRVPEFRLSWQEQ